MALAVLLAVTTRTWIAHGDYVPSASMVPALLPGDWILACPLAYGIRDPFGGGWWVRWRDPSPGDVVVFTRPPGVRYVKRVAATGGETVEVRDGRVWVGGRPRQVRGGVGPAAATDTGPILPPLLVPPRTAFVLGDARASSRDSRIWGPVPFDAIEGKAVVVFWSADPEAGAVRWARVGRRVR